MVVRLEVAKEGGNQRGRGTTGTRTRNVDGPLVLDMHGAVLFDAREVDRKERKASAIPD